MSPGNDPARPKTGHRCAAAISTHVDLDAAIAEVADDIEASLDGAAPDLLFAFATHHYGGDLPRLPGELVEATSAEALAGCTGSWAVGAGREEEHMPGLAVLAAILPDTRVQIARIQPPSEGGPESLELHVPSPETSSMILLADPFTFPTTPWLESFHRDTPEVPLVGGLSSGGVSPGQNLLFAGSDALNSGGLAVVLDGATRLVPALSQGCRPIGPPIVATKVDGNVILELRGEPAAKVMFEILEALEETERRLFQSGAFIGRAVDASRSSYRASDLLVRGVMGLDPKRHAIVVADEGLRAGATLQLMVRDAPSATNELNATLEVAGLESAGQAFGGLLFTCGGRGQAMFGRPHHDASALERSFGPGFPLAGFAASGEIGPVAGSPFLHGFSASSALFVPRD